MPGHRWRAARKAHRQAAEIEAGLPPILQPSGDAEAQDGHARLKRASTLLFVKNEIIAALSEFIGTFLFLFLAYGIANSASQQQIIASSTGGTKAGSGLDPSSLLLSSLGFGFSLAVNAFIFFRVSGGLFNPAVTLALFITKSLSFVRFCSYIIVQLLGALAAAGLADALIPGELSVRTRLSSTTSVGQGFVIEMLMTAQLVIAVFLLAGEKHKGTFIAPIGIGLALFICEMWATSLTGGSLNPARSLGPDVVARQFDGTAWIYYAGPFVGALVATAIYQLLLWGKYETVNADQDDDGMALLMRNADGVPVGFVDQTNKAHPDVAAMIDANDTVSRVPTRESSKVRPQSTEQRPEIPIDGIDMRDTKQE